MAYPASAVANFFVEWAQHEGQSVDPMKLQKLLYFAHGWYLGLRDQPLINEPIEAWDFGPVVRSVYHALKQYGPNAIAKPIEELEPSGDGFEIVIPRITNDDTQQFLRRIWDVYGKFSASDLTAMTHRPNTPWTEVLAKSTPGARGIVIPDSVMREHFAALAKQNAAGRTVPVL